MTDNTEAQNEGLWLPEDIWAFIACFLDNDDLAKFRQLCKTTQFVGSHAAILQPLYNRLYAIYDTLPPLLPQESTLSAFKQAFEKIQIRQQFEISYLTVHHSNLMAKAENAQVLEENTTVSLKSSEAINALLDKINSEIIKAKIDLNSTRLDISSACITRLPVSLFQTEGYTNFWQNLTYLNCDNNLLTTLNVHELAALRLLYCDNNQLTTLNVQGLAALRVLYCDNNQLTTLNVQGFVFLRWLHCDNNPLKTLILTGVHPVTKNRYGELERSLLLNPLSQSDCAQTSTFLPSFEANNHTPENPDLKRKRDENGMQLDGVLQKPDNQPDLKKRKIG